MQPQSPITGRWDGDFSDPHVPKKRSPPGVRTAVEGMEKPEGRRPGQGTGEPGFGAAAHPTCEICITRGPSTLPS